MATYVIYQCDVLDAERYEAYKPKAAASVRAAGGRYIVRGGDAEVLEWSIFWSCTGLENPQSADLVISGAYMPRCRPQAGQPHHVPVPTLTRHFFSGTGNEEP
jgi:hypothetical protein